jgi:5-methylthioadenosine/S-adenosylhomocysteine deaminase
MFNEFRWLAGRDTGLSLAALLELSTLAGARALGYAKETGSLEVGKRADLAVIRLPQRQADDPHELLLDEEAAVTAGNW